MPKMETKTKSPSIPGYDRDEGGADDEGVAEEEENAQDVADDSMASMVEEEDCIGKKRSARRKRILNLSLSLNLHLHLHLHLHLLSPSMKATQHMLTSFRRPLCRSLRRCYSGSC
jgi:hypothetical protein